MAMIETWYTQDLQQPVKVHYLHGNVFSQDNQGNKVGVTVTDGGAPANLSGTVSASIIRADGATVAATGTLTGNAAFVVLPAAAYAVPGMLSIVIKLTGDGSTTTLCAVVANVYQSATDVTVDPGTIVPDIAALIATINDAILSIPSDYGALVRDVQAINDEIGGIVFNFSVDSVAGWTEKIIVPGISLKKDDFVTIEADFTPAVSSSTYIYLNNGDTQISYSQVNGLSSKVITYKATADISQFRVTTNSQSYTGKINVKLTLSSRQTQVEENRITAHELAVEKPGFFSLQRLSPFVRGGYDYPNFNYNTHQISSRDVMTAPFPLYMRVKSGFHAKTLTVSGGSATDSGWQTNSLFVPAGTQFVVKIERAVPDTSEVADVDEFLSNLVVYSDYLHWFDIKKFADDVATGLAINLATGATQSAGSYFFLYSFKNPAFKFIKLDASLYDRNVAAIAFYSSETIGAESYISGANQGAWIENNFVYAEVPAECKLVCFVSRNVLNDNTPHNIGIYADDATKYIEKEGVETEIISLRGKDIKSCIGCLKCTETKNCVLNDGLEEVIDKLREADGFIPAAPVYFGTARGDMMSALQRIGKVSRGNDKFLNGMVGGPIAVARRGGQSLTLQEMTMFFPINGMIVVGANYWNIVFAGPEGTALEDSEGIANIRLFGENVANVVKKLNE